MPQPILSGDPMKSSLRGVFLLASVAASASVLAQGGCCRGSAPRRAYSSVARPPPGKPGAAYSDFRATGDSLARRRAKTLEVDPGAAQRVVEKLPFATVS